MINNNYFGDNKGYICAYQQFKAKSSLIDGRYMTGDDKDWHKFYLNDIPLRQ